MASHYYTADVLLISPTYKKININLRGDSLSSIRSMATILYPKHVIQTICNIRRHEPKAKIRSSTSRFVN